MLLISSSWKLFLTPLSQASMSQHISGSVITFLTVLSLLSRLHFSSGPLRASFSHDLLPNSLLSADSFFATTFPHHPLSSLSDFGLLVLISSFGLYFLLPAGHLYLDFLLSPATLILIMCIYFPKPVLHHVFLSIIAITTSSSKKPSHP